MQFLLDLALKSAVILLVALALTALCRRAGAAARHRIWSAAVCGLLALPMLTLALPGWRMPLLPSSLIAAPPAVESKAPVAVQRLGATVAESPSATVEAPIDASPVPVSAAPESSTSNNSSGSNISTSRPDERGFPVSPLTIVLCIWLVGVLAVFARLLSGTIRIWRLARQARSMNESSWETLVRGVSERLNLRRRVRLLSSERVALPMTCGALRSVVVLPEEAERWSTSCRRAVLLHELAHVERRDCLTQTLAQVSCALYWFNPLVWLAARRLRIERELACDDRVLEVGTRASDYAAHLVEIASSFKGAQISPVVAGMGGTQLERRVQAILDPQGRRRGWPRAGAWRLDLVAAGLIVLLAVVQPWADSATAQSSSALTGIGSTVAVVGAVHDPSGSPVGERSARTLTTKTNQTAENKKTDRAESESVSGHGGARSSDQEAAQSASQETDQGQNRNINVTVEQMVQMKVHGVTNEYIESLRRVGFDHLKIDMLVSLKIHGVTEDYVNQTRQWVGDDLSLNKLLQMRIHGVTPEYARRMRDLGFTNLTVDRLTEMRIHGVSEAFIREMRELGFDNLSLDKAVQLRIHGVTREYVQKMRAAGFTNASVEDLINMRIHGIDRILLKSSR